MKVYLSDEPIWLLPTPEQLAFGGKKLVVVEGKSETVVNLRFSEADPAGVHAGKSSVTVWEPWSDAVSWMDAPFIQPPPAAKLHHRPQFLSQEALDSIRRNDDGPQYGELLLVIPSEAESLGH